MCDKEKKKKRERKCNRRPIYLHFVLVDLLYVEEPSST